MRHTSVLFVDDEPNMLKALTRTFKDYPWRVSTAENGEEALKVLAESGPYDIIVADQRMPGMTGVQLLKRVRHLNPHCVRVILSGYADIEDVLDAINEGHVYKFLMKDMNTEVLKETMSHLVRAIELARENQRLTGLIEKTRQETEAVAELLNDLQEMEFDPVLESVFRSAIEELPVPVALVGINGKAVYMNPACASLLGGLATEDSPAEELFKKAGLSSTFTKEVPGLPGKMALTMHLIERPG